METSIIIKAALATVGTVQMVKNFICIKNKKLWTLITIISGVIYSLPFIPLWLLDTIIVVCGATLFYDTIFKTFEKLFQNGGNDE